MFVGTVAWDVMAIHLLPVSPGVMFVRLNMG
jgi:hypothetical protein